jgi:hypothetical protein
VAMGLSKRESSRVTMGCEKAYKDDDEEVVDEDKFEMTR